MAGDAAGLLDALEIGKAHIVGASMGGMIAQLFAARWPKRTLSLTSIMSSTGNPALPGASRQTMGLLLPGERLRVSEAGRMLTNRLILELASSNSSRA